MDFSPDENQQAIAELAAGVLRKGADDSGDAVWSALAKAGLTALAVPVELGGDGLGVDAVTAVLTQVGAKAAPVPALAALALGVLPLSSHGTPDQQRQWLPDVATGATVLTAALSEPGAPLSVSPRTSAIRVADGWRLDGSKVAVLYAEQAAQILVSASVEAGSAVFLVDPRAAGVTLTRTPTSTGLPEAAMRLDGVVVPAGAVLGGDLTGAVLAATRAYALAGAAALGDGALAGALELTTEHLRTRHQFGKPLATFQAVAQQIADVYIASRTVHLAAVSAAWRLSAGLDAAEDAHLAAYWLAAEALPALRTCHHLHGGIGVDITYPLHRYYSTLKDLTRFVGGPDYARDALARLPRPDAVADAAVGADGGTFIDLTATQRALRDEFRAYFARLMTAEERTAMLTERHGPVFRDIVRRMGRDGRLGVGWPTEFGGRGFGPIEQHLFVDEAARADVQLPSVTLQTVGPTLQAFGTDEQKAFFLPKILSGEVHFAIGYSEPDAGTDLASLRTTAVRDGDDYVVNGQKIFTTGGHDADYIWLAVRTDPSAPKHRGISILIVDTRDPGYSWTPIITCDGAHHVNATYYNDVRVPANMLVGTRDAGWKLITTQLNHERVMLGPAGRIGSLYDRVHAWAVEHGLLEIADVRAALTETRATERVNELLNWQVAAADSAGRAVDVADASATKVFGSERVQRINALLEEVVGRHGDPTDPSTAALLSWLDVQAKRNLVITFGGGVNEIQRELIAMTGLALPRVPR